MKNLLIIAQKVDEEDDLVGFFVDWIREFSKHFDNVFVITLLKGSYALPANVSVYSLGKERNSSRIARAFNFYKYLFLLIPKSEGVFAHMSPIFAVVAWPATFVYRKKLVLWYLHRSVTARLKIALALCDNIVTAAKDSLNIKSNKIIELGHGINAESFKTDRDWFRFSRSNLKDGSSRFDLGKILSVGRISPIKNFETIINAASILKNRGFNFEVKIVGEPVMRGDASYFESLKKLVSKLNLENEIKFEGFVPYSKIAGYYKEADFFVGPLPPGGVDKAMLEAMASGCISLTSNSVFKKYLGNYSERLIFGYKDSNDLALKLEGIWNASDKDAISRFMVDSVKKNHDLNNLIIQISHLYER